MTLPTPPGVFVDYGSVADGSPTINDWGSVALPAVLFEDWEAVVGAAQIASTNQVPKPVNSIWVARGERDKRYEQNR